MGLLFVAADAAKLYFGLMYTEGTADPFNWIQDDKGEYRYDMSSVKSVEMRKEGEGRYCDYWFGEIRNVTSRRVRYAFFLTGKEKESVMYGCNQIIDLKQEREPDNVFN